MNPIPPSNRSPLRATLYEIIFKADTPAGKAFDVVLIGCILASVGVVMLESIQSVREGWKRPLRIAEWGFTVLFTVEYLLRLYCVADKRRYARSFFGVIDLLAIVPTYLTVVPGVHLFRVLRILRVLRVFRVLKLGNHMKQADLLRRALYASRQKIIVFLCFVLTLVVIIGAVMYTIEEPVNDGFASIPESIYWAIVTLTTVGYGDISPQTPTGKMLAAMVMLLGYAIIAVPTGIVTAQIIRTPEQPERRCNACGCDRHDADAAFCKQCGAPVPRPD